MSGVDESQPKFVESTWGCYPPKVIPIALRKLGTWHKSPEMKEVFEGGSNFGWSLHDIHLEGSGFQT